MSLHMAVVDSFQPKLGCPFQGDQRNDDYNDRVHACNLKEDRRIDRLIRGGELKVEG